MSTLLSILIFIGVLSLVFVTICVIGRKGKINARNAYIFRHKFNSNHPYINPDEMHFQFCELLDMALKDKKKVAGLEFRLIIDENENDTKL